MPIGAFSYRNAAKPSRPAPIAPATTSTLPAVPVETALWLAFELTLATASLAELLAACVALCSPCCAVLKAFAALELNALRALERVAAGNVDPADSRDFFSEEKSLAIEDSPADKSFEAEETAPDT